MTTLAKRHWNAGRAIGGGAVAGIIGGLAMAVLLLILTVARGGDAWVALKGAGTPFLGRRAALPGFDGVAVLVGLLCHLAVSTIWGALFGTIVYGLGAGPTMLMGLVWGFVVWLGMYYVVLPIAGMGQVAEQTPKWQGILPHEVFGLFLGLGFLPFQRRYAPPTRPWLDRTQPTDQPGRPVY